ncbi:hypothetical protein PIB30_108566, partial [Stylosanthes scabra]|nr:hypothetical protein [Stylosanthes scabra]
MRALPVAKNGLPSMIDGVVSSPISRMTKSAGSINFPTFTNTFSTTPKGNLMALSASDA